jgi:hypothetical protein
MLSMLHRTNESRNDRMWRAAPWMLHGYNDAIGQACGQPRFLSGMRIHPALTGRDLPMHDGTVIMRQPYDEKTLAHNIRASGPFGQFGGADEGTVMVTEVQSDIYAAW